MLCPEMVPEVPFPWLPKHKQYNEHFSFRDYETNEIISKLPYLWWMERRIGGYKLCWKDLACSKWVKLYNIKPDLFLCPWILLARFYYWQACYKQVMRALQKE
jgi:hypothetical protein